VVIFTAVSPAQNNKNDKAATAASSIYIISANAGGVNYTSGTVEIAKKDGKGGYLYKGDTVDVGDKVSTTADGRAEILLNPGSYLRLSENSRFEFASTSLDDLKVKLQSGSAIFEVVADNHFKVTVEAGRDAFYLIKSGIYRVDAGPDGGGKISVWKGLAQAGTSTVKGGQFATISGGQTLVAKFDRDDRSALEIWSKERAKEIAQINQKLIRNSMNNSLLSSFSQTNISAFGGYGLWVYDPVYRASCFLPFGYGFRSAYGIGYNQTIWNYTYPSYIVERNNPNFNGNPVSSGGANTGNTNANNGNNGNDRNGSNRNHRDGNNNGSGWSRPDRQPRDGNGTGNGGWQRPADGTPRGGNGNGGWQRPPDRTPRDGGNNGGGGWSRPERSTPPPSPQNVAPSQPSIQDRKPDTPTNTSDVRRID